MLLPGIQIFNNDDTSCPEKHGGKNASSMYIDSSEPVFPGESMWRKDDSLKLECYNPVFTKTVECDCKTYEVTHSEYEDGKVPRQVEFHSGLFTRVDKQDSYGLLAPLYQNIEKQLYLFSHHPEGLVWQVSQKLTTTPIRAVTTTKSCPDNKDLEWEWYNTTTRMGQQLYVKDKQVQVKCADN